MCCVVCVFGVGCLLLISVWLNCVWCMWCLMNVFVLNIVFKSDVCVSLLFCDVDCVLICV